MKKFEQFGKVIRDIRKAHDMTQAQACELIGGIHSQFWSNAERGLCALPKERLMILKKKLKLDEKDCRRMIDALASDAAKYTRQDFAKALKVGA